MNSETRMRLVIVGGGTAGWMTAAAVSHLLHSSVQVTLVESEQIGTVGVGEATIPHLRYFNQRLGIREDEFMRTCQATYKLGIEFINWGQIGESYIHPFGDFGDGSQAVPFHHYWQRAKAHGDSSSLFEYSLPVQLAKKGKFVYPRQTPNPLEAAFSYAFHIDASLYAQYLRNFCSAKGVSRIEGQITDVKTSAINGDIDAVILNDGRTVEGDIFIDCSGFRSLLLGKTLGVGYESWAEHLPCDRAVAVPTESVGSPLPYTQATAHAAGWRWRIPLRHRVGNGSVYCSRYMSDDEAAANLLTNVKGRPLAEPKFLHFEAGRRHNTWSHNCIAVGLSSGFLEPLESTSIYLIQASIMKLIDLFPGRGDCTLLRAEFNRQMTLEYDRIRDFLILHYHATRREDSPFWRYCKNMKVPSSLEEKMDTFKMTGQVERYRHGLFLLPSWIAVYLGQGIVPESYHRQADELSLEQINKGMRMIKAGIDAIVEAAPDHEQALAHNGDSEKDAWPVAAMSLYGVFS